MYKRNLSNVKYFSALFTLASLLFSLVIPTVSSVKAAPDQKSAANASKTPGTVYGKPPLIFEQNKGQANERAKFISRGPGFMLYLTDHEAVFSLRSGENTSDTLRMQFAGANLKPAITGEDKSVTRTNYYTGKKRFEDIGNYSRVNYKDLYDGVDAVFYGTPDRQLEYDLIVAAGVDTGKIALVFEGAETLSVNDLGELTIKTANTELVQHKPVSYQEKNGRRIEVASRYAVEGNTVRFEIGEYDRSIPLTIDPKIGYLTYFGGNGFEYVGDVKVDAAGNAFIAGSSSSTNLPGPNPGNNNISFAGYVSKISPDGSTVLYTTFLDGDSVDGQSAFNLGVIRPDLALDPQGNAYIAGGTDSGNFPVTPGAYQTTRQCTGVFTCEETAEGFVSKLNANGQLVYSTFLGGRWNDYVHSIVVDPAGKAYVTGGTLSGLTFPTKNQYQGTGGYHDYLDAFLTVFNADGSDIVYSTGLGGSSSDQGNEIAIDASNNVYIVGSTDSTNFPTKTPFQSVNRGGRDTFVAKFNTSLSGNSSLIYSTLLGGAGTDEGFGIAVDPSNQAVITGITGSFNFPLQNAFRSTNQINEAFVSIIGANGSTLVKSSFLGGSDQDEGLDVTLGPDGSIYVVGSTLSTDFPAILAFQSSKGADRDGFITKIKFGPGILSSSYLGGSGFDETCSVSILGNKIFVGGISGSDNLQTTSGVLQPAKGNSTDGFVAKLIDSHKDSVGVFRPASTFILTQSTTNVVSQGATLTSELAGQRGVAGDWNGDGVDSIGSFTNGTWKVRDSNFPLFVPPVKTITFGAAGDLPVVGDWDGDGVDTPGVFRPSTGQFTLTDSTATNPAFIRGPAKVNFGTAGDLPIAGDWDGDGKDSIGVYRPSTGETFFTNANVESGQGVTLNPGIDFIAFLGIAEDLPFAGDWNGDGKDSLGLWRPSTTEMILSDDNINLRAVFLFGQSTDQPIAGDWDGIANP